MFNYGVIGGGIVGLATALNILQRKPGASLILIEKEERLGRHQTGHNSGVIHSGIYYSPGSLKANLCRKGAIATRAFCTEHAIPYEICGKMIVATTELEVTRLAVLSERARANDIDVELLDRAQLRHREPHIAGLHALFVKNTGIVDYCAISSCMGELIRARGGEIKLGFEIDSIRESASKVSVTSGDVRWEIDRLVVCGGLQSDRLAGLAGLQTAHRIIPFRGEYFRLPTSRVGIIQRLIYPVPDPELPFLGVHLTRLIDGNITVGPNAVMGFSREGYAPRSAKFSDVIDFAKFPGFWRMLWQHRRFAAGEMRNSLFKAAYLKECQKYCPELGINDLLYHEAGIRAQAVMRDGSLVHDFLFLETPRMLHVCNAPSPAATSAIPIGQMIAEKCT